MDAWLAAFASELNQGTNTASVNAANGVGNEVGGDVVAQATQDGGDTELSGPSLYDLFGGPDINIGVNVATVVAGNGVGNDIDGDVVAQATQDVGDTDVGGGPSLYDFFGGPDINIGVNVANVIAGNGVGNSIDGSVLALADQTIGDTEFAGLLA
ncbi:hypothetical protein [Chthonobacter rhizosphaerae]|uniref:hypothetical protein n=1 Tax=Chthonobacter rhizosphaerae TaxID=2735553 RepID=UPI0015EEF218|nr:hypothetical protein [Chthonobacter rhizosphaerae]